MINLSKTLRWLGCSAALGLACAVPVQSAVFLDFEGVEGESQNVRHHGEIEVLSWSWGMATVVDPITGAGKADFQSLSFAKVLDKSTPKLMEYCAKGTLAPKAVLTFRQPGETTFEYYKVVLEDVLIKGYSVSSSTGDDALPEQVSLSFKRAGVQYISITPTGEPQDPIRFSWDIAGNTEGGVTFPDDFPPDRDDDGLPDEWEIAYGLDPAVSDAGADSDGDGATNYEEFVAGTSPANKDQVLKASLSSDGSLGNLTWSSVPGKQYRVLLSDSLDQPFQEMSVYPSDGDTTSIPVPADFVTRFFRIEVVQDQ